jgi:phage-related protein
MALLTDKKKVIPLKPEHTAWVFMSFETEQGIDVVLDWDAPKTFEAELAFENLVKTERKTKNYTEWPSWRHKMQGEAGKRGVVELGFKADGRSYRVLSMFNGSMCIVLLCICYHKGSVWTPKNAIEIATKRAKLVLAKKAKLNVIQITDDL